MKGKLRVKKKKGKCNDFSEHWKMLTKVRVSHGEPSLDEPENSPLDEPENSPLDETENSRLDEPEISRLGEVTKKNKKLKVNKHHS